MQFLNTYNLLFKMNTAKKFKVALIYNSTKIPNSLELSHKTVSLTIYPSLTNEQIDTILSAVIVK